MLDRLDRLSANQKLILDICVPFLYLLPLVIVWFSPKNFGFGSQNLAYAGWGLGVFGVLIWIVSMFQLGSSLAVRPGAEKIITRGIYKYLRHPVYVGIVFTLTGLMIAAGSIFGLAYVALVVIPLNIARARLEEKALTEQFGQPYLDYKTTTWF